MTDTISRQAAIDAIMEYFPADTINNPKYHAGKSLVQALTTLPAVGGWMDIESAPRDGVILIYADGPDGYVVSDASWNNGIWASASLGMNDVVSHWQPLPAPPIE